MPDKPIIAIMYDFDKTLCGEDMQNYSFIPALGMTPNEFWGATGKFSDETGVERILAYMYMMVKMSSEKGIKLTREYLYSLGKDIRYYEGVRTWFKRINEYGLSKGVRIEHYLISSGNKEIIVGCDIASEFKEIYACEFHFDKETKLPVWPKLAINYTAKTQFYFRISKGILDVKEDTAVNRKGDKRIPHHNIVFIGDGMTDVPIMNLVKKNGGNSIAVYPKNQENKIDYLLEDDRVNFKCSANYRAGSKLEKIIKLVIDQVSVTNEIEKHQEL
jgi:hypothetical protein